MGETPASRPGREERGPEGSPAFIPHGLPLWGESFRAPVTGGPKWKWGVRKVSRLVGEGEERDIPSQTAGWTEPRYRVKGQGLGGKLGAWSCSLGAQMGSLPDKRVQGGRLGTKAGWERRRPGSRPPRDADLTRVGPQPRQPPYPAGTPLPRSLSAHGPSAWSPRPPTSSRVWPQVGLSERPCPSPYLAAFSALCLPARGAHTIYLPDCLAPWSVLFAVLPQCLELGGGSVNIWKS